MITVLFFAQIKELTGIDSVKVDSGFASVEEIRSHLSSQGGKWDIALDREKLLVAVNQEIVALDTLVEAGDEVAFFPPVTGG
ncbi:molybdopterin synthase sulfur carrier subunit [Vibrio sp. 10N.286.49.B3]|uniref:molybdopterin synthase sulfur carrier subunit n=1 Tax=Vibrio sp. 10N.286.49.B3 TaxID=1880855 RepID=UPI000C8610D5|nr:molybdopterin synthase sulfur carrier subunit [Vibrio sp. 10N.286.49.B3]PMH41911.1 molybdopterin synthase sulfur carrier subunit [Vibrio sp. 10N.286.49.B3]